MRNQQLEGADIAQFLHKELQGPSLRIERPSTLEDAGPSTFNWVKKYSARMFELIESRHPALVICDSATAAKTTIPHIVSENPRLDFIRVLNKYFQTETPTGIHPTAVIAPGAHLGRGVSIGPHSHIGKDVVLGDNCSLGSGVVLEGNISVGNGGKIKSNSVLGAPGFGFEYDEDNRPIHFPHLGRIVIEEDVWIGACTTIERGTLGETKLESGCKVDDLVQIGHNVHIGKNTLIMANSVICGGARVGERCWIAPNSVIKEKILIGNRAIIGLGAVVLNDVEDDTVVAGVPAKPLKPKAVSTNRSE